MEEIVLSKLEINRALRITIFATYYLDFKHKLVTVYKESVATIRMTLKKKSGSLLGAYMRRQYNVG
jgi:hypothetical protein